MINTLYYDKKEKTFYISTQILYKVPKEKETKTLKKFIKHKFVPDVKNTLQTVKLVLPLSTDCVAVNSSGLIATLNKKKYTEVLTQIKKEKEVKTNYNNVFDGVQN